MLLEASILMHQDIKRAVKTRECKCAAMIDFGREVCGNLALSAGREWLVTNGIGGYASGPIAGLPTRRYHGLLVAALKPPLAHSLAHEAG